MTGLAIVQQGIGALGGTWQAGVGSRKKWLSSRSNHALTHNHTMHTPVIVQQGIGAFEAHDKAQSCPDTHHTCIHTLHAQTTHTTHQQTVSLHNMHTHVEEMVELKVQPLSLYNIHIHVLKPQER